MGGWWGGVFVVVEGGLFFSCSCGSIGEMRGGLCVEGCVLCGGMV